MGEGRGEGLGEALNSKTHFPFEPIANLFYFPTR